MKKAHLFTFFFALLGLSVTAQSLQEVLTYYEENTGGLSRWQSLQSTRITGKASQMGMEFPFTLIQARPNKQKLMVDIQGSKLVEAFDGSVAWTINPFMGGSTPTKKSPDETRESMKQMFEDELLGYASKGHTASLGERETVEGVNCIVVKLVTKEGDERIYYFDPENYVPIMVKTFATSGDMKGMAMEQYLSDYQEVEGLMMPFSMTTKVMGQTVANLKFTKIECNVPVQDSEFAFPGK